jgi:hypothetical protein
MKRFAAGYGSFLDNRFHLFNLGPMNAKLRKIEVDAETADLLEAREAAAG